MPKKTKTSSFGVSKREGHDSSDFYNRSLYESLPSAQPAPGTDLDEPAMRATGPSTQAVEGSIDPTLSAAPGDWIDRIYCRSAEELPLPDNSIALAFTSPPYNVGKQYDENRSLEDYLDLIRRVGSEVYRVLKPGGRYVINIANLGRKPYIPLHAHFYGVHIEAGFLPMGEIIWQKGKGANSSCAWGSWKSAKSPKLRDVHEYLIVLAKGSFSRPDKGESDIAASEFMEGTLSVWQIPPESARKVGHPAPFPIALAQRVIKLYSYIDDVVLDPFMGSGTTCVAAKLNHRHYVGVDMVQEYCALGERRVRELEGD